MTPLPPARDPRRATATAALLVLGSCISLQFGAALAYQLFPAVGAWGMTTLRLGLAAIVLLLVVRPRVRSWTRSQWLATAAFGAALAGMNGFFYWGISTVPLGPAVAIEFLGPLVLTAVLSRGIREWAWLIPAMIGMGLFAVDHLRGVSHLDPLGLVFILVAGLFWALYILASERAGRKVEGAGGLAVAVTIAAVLVAPFGLSSAVPAVVADSSLLLLALPAALLASVIPYSLEFAALRRLPKPVFGILLSLEPAVAALAGFLLLGQGMSVLGACAVALVVAASIGSTLGARAPRKERVEVTAPA
ncbi:EamA family transporter [Galactobacter valiniphilus]|uniref:EamA family transporter n=1 Tax=Galactobacter valiniphilus TaxID=2676122 RepID=UPI00373627AF